MIEGLWKGCIGDFSGAPCRRSFSEDAQGRKMSSGPEKAFNHHNSMHWPPSTLIACPVT